MERKIFICEDSFEGILTGVYDAYICRYDHQHIALEIMGSEQPQFFCSYYPVDTDIEKAAKVGAAIKEKISEAAWQQLHQASMAADHKKADAIYHYLVMGFKIGAAVMNNLANDHVRTVMKLAKSVGMESHHLYGFVRFTQVNDELMFSKIAPKHDQIVLLAPHFADRFPEENFIIYDEQRRKACIHRAGAGYGFMSNINSETLPVINDDDDMYIELWKSFVETIDIKERRNKRQQMNMMPKRYWPNMTEMKEKL